VPEGDTLFRTAATLHRWLAGRELTQASTRVKGFPAHRLLGQQVDSVEAQGKHLLVRFESGDVLHTRLRMAGSWHVYRAGERWRRPESQARLVLTCGDRVAVCFNAPVVELLTPGGEAVHPSLSRLGPDVLAAPLDLAEIRRRARSRSPDLAVGELLLDQRVAAGIGNIYRCEALFLERHSPWLPQSSLSDEDLDRLFTTSSRLMRASVAGRRPATVGTAGPAPTPASSSAPALAAGAFDPALLTRYVYRRAGRPCRRCGTLIQARRQGELARTAYWCPTCQA
jgi:endonuclease-8